MYTPATRWLEAALRLAAWGTTLLVAATFLLHLAGRFPEPNPRGVLKVMALYALLPLVAAAAVRRSRRTELTPAGFKPTALRAWRLPLPGRGFRALFEGGAARDVLLRPETARALASEVDDPLQRYALLGPWPSLGARVFKFGAFPLFPALVVFRAYEVIGWGGFLGEAQLFGWRRWVTNLVIHWGMTLVVLVCWAAVWRLLSETAALAGAFIGPRAARGARVSAEVLSALAYYAGVPAVLAVLFLR